MPDKPTISLLEYISINLSNGKKANDKIDWVNCPGSNADISVFQNTWESELTSRGMCACIGKNVYKFVVNCLGGLCPFSDLIIYNTLAHFKKTGAVETSPKLVFNENLAIASLLAATNGISEITIRRKYNISDENSLKLKLAWSFLTRKIFEYSLLCLSSSTLTSGIQTLSPPSVQQEFQ